MVPQVPHPYGEHIMSGHAVESSGQKAGLWVLGLVVITDPDPDNLEDPKQEPEVIAAPPLAELLTTIPPG